MMRLNVALTTSNRRRESFYDLIVDIAEMCPTKWCQCLQNDGQTLPPCPLTILEY